MSDKGAGFSRPRGHYCLRSINTGLGEAPKGRTRADVQKAAHDGNCSVRFDFSS